MININKFHGDGDIRTWLNQPVVINDRVIATDGHKILILKNKDLSSYDDIPPEAKPDAKMHLINLIELHDNWVSWSDIQPLIVWPDKALCEICNGSGKATTNKCPECDGDGAVDAETEYNTYHDLKCKTCDGKGLEVNLRTDQDCPRCDGNSVAYVPYDSVDVLGITVQAQYLNLIIDETGLELGANHDRNMLIFRAGPDVHGAIMALRK